MTSMIMLNSNGWQLCQQRKWPEWQQYDRQVDNKDKDGQLPVELNMEPVRSYYCFKAWFKFLLANVMIDGDAQVRLDCPNRTAVTVSYYSQVRQLHALKISLRLDLSHDNHLMVFFFFTSSSSSSTLASSSSASPPSSSASGKSQDPRSLQSNTTKPLKSCQKSIFWECFLCFRALLRAQLLKHETGEISQNSWRIQTSTNVYILCARIFSAPSIWLEPHRQWAPWVP